jgi:hypothetical protein
LWAIRQRCNQIEFELREAQVADLARQRARKADLAQRRRRRLEVTVFN